MMFRNSLAVVGGLFLLCYFKPALGQKVPLINSLPLPEITINWAGKPNNKITDKTTDKPTDKQIVSTPEGEPTPSPSLQQKGKRWGINIELKSNIGDQSDR